MRNEELEITGVGDEPEEFPLAMGPWEDVAPDSVRNDRLISCGDETSRCIYFAVKSAPFSSSTAQIFPHAFGTRTSAADIGYL